MAGALRETYSCVSLFTFGLARIRSAVVSKPTVIVLDDDLSVRRVYQRRGPRRSTRLSQAFVQYGLESRVLALRKGSGVSTEMPAS